jgi:L-alanine-DL-glutamate epimerase-like enolase superfamily enzyme
MKITGVEAIELRLPESFAGPRLIVRQTLIIKVHTDEGIVGIGEVDSCPTVVRATVDAPPAKSPISGLASVIIGQNPLEIRQLNDLMYQSSFDYGRGGVVLHTIGGIDIALWDIAGKYYNQPIYRLLGGPFQTRLRAYASTLFGSNGKETAEEGKKWVDKGFTAVKFGWVPMGESEKLDLELVEGARRGIGDDCHLMVDAGCCWDTATAIKRAQQFEDYNVFWLEEPLARDNIDGYGQITSVSRIPIAAGEGEAGRYAFRNFIERGRIHIAQIDLVRNGITESMRIADMAEDSGLKVVNHHWSSDINLAASLHFLAARKSTFILEYCVAESPIRWEVTRKKIEIDADGRAKVPEGPGLGIELNEETIERYRVN